MFDSYVYADTKNIRDFNNFLAFFKILVLNKFKAAYIKLKKAGLLEQFKVKKKKLWQNPYPMKILHRYFIQHLAVFLTMISKKNARKKLQMTQKLMEL